MKGDTEADQAHRDEMAKIRKATRVKSGRSPLPHYAQDEDGHLVARVPPPGRQKPRPEKVLVTDYEPGAEEGL